MILAIATVAAFAAPAAAQRHEYYELREAQQLAAAAVRVTAALHRESEPAPVKYALSTMNLVAPRVRLPLVELMGESRAEIDAVLARLCEKYPGYMIGKLARPDQTTVQPVNRGRPQRKFAVVS
jgi:dihydrodipicolinate synthase/N-acetylneuraminate lyase